MTNYLRKSVGSIDRLSSYAVVLSGISILLIMIIEVVNAIGRKLGMPFPCTLEMAESLMIPCIFMATAIVASREDHTFVTITTRKLPGAVRRTLDAAANLLSAIVVTILAAGAWNIAIASAGMYEMRIGVFRFPIWPFKIIYAVGFSLLAIQFLMNVLRCILDLKDKQYTPD